MPAAPDAIHTRTVYRLFGFTLASNFPFTRHLSRGEGRPNLTFDYATVPPFLVRWNEIQPSYEVPCTVEGERCLVRGLYAEDCEAIRFSAVADFFLWRDRIVACGAPGANLQLMESIFLGIVTGLWLERRGVRMMHGAAVDVDGFAVAFLGPKGAGKSTLAAVMMRRGYPLVSDDILAIEHTEDGFVVQPGLPEIRLRSDQIGEITGDAEPAAGDSDRSGPRKIYLGVNGGGFAGASGPRPLACMYLPERTRSTAGGPPAIEGVSGRKAARAILKNTLLPRLVSAMGLASARLDFASRLAARTAVRRLVYPSDLSGLRNVAEAVLNDLRGLG